MAVRDRRHRTRGAGHGCGDARGAGGDRAGARTRSSGSTTWTRSRRSTTRGWTRSSSARCSPPGSVPMPSRVPRGSTTGCAGSRRSRRRGSPIWPSYADSIRRVREQLLDPELAPWFALDADGRRIARRPTEELTLATVIRSGAGDRRPPARLAGTTQEGTRAREDDGMTETLANRRVFRSKVDSIRPTYGFEDVSLAPGTDTVDPADIVVAQDFCGIRLETPVLAAAMDAVADVRLSGELARLGGLSILNLEGVQFRYDDPSEVIDRVIAAPDDARPGRPRGGVPRPDPRGADRAPDRRAPCRGLEGGAVGDAGHRAEVRAVRRRARRGPVPRPVAGLVGAPPGDRLRAARPVRVHPVHADPGRRRQHDQRRGGVPAHGAGRRGHLRRGRAGRRVHDAGGAGHRDPAGHRDLRRGRGPRRVPRRDRALRARSSPTAA